MTLKLSRSERQSSVRFVTLSSRSSQGLWATHNSQVFAGDACVFLTTPAVNPMISIMSMSRRTAETIKRSLGGH
jgi:hypothetical protein